tara:strand:- start:853 stop:1125 length:273 start_codon:yes stop_codon:yes gene_type:complete
MPLDFEPKELITFYEETEEFVTRSKTISEELKVVTLFRLALELASKDMGLVEAAYLMARLQHITLGLALGRDDSFEGIIEEYSKKKPTIN